MGVSTEVLRAPLPEGGLSEIIAMTQPSIDIAKIQTIFAPL